jgi:hypothetical protein
VNWTETILEPDTKTERFDHGQITMNGTASDTPITFAFNDGQNATSMVVGSKVRSWANFSLLQLYYHRNAWANLHLLGQSNTFLAPGVSDGCQLRADLR